MQLGIDTFIPASIDGTPQNSPQHNALKVSEVLDEIVLADQVGLHVVGIGEHHRPDYIASAPTIMLAAAAARTKKIRLASAVTVLSSEDPVRVFQQFASIDLISGGRAEIIVGRGSFIESYPLFGFDLAHYDELFKEKLELLLKIRDETFVNWKGNFRTPLTGQGIYPRPLQNPLPIRLGVGGTPASFTRAGELGLPLIVAIIGGEPHRFRPLIDRYREAYRKAGHDPAKLEVGVHAFGFVADSNEKAIDTFMPAYMNTMNKIGVERGWSPMSRGHFDSLLGPHGALIVGDPQTVAVKLHYINESLGGISQVAIQLNPSTVDHAASMHAIELLGKAVSPDVTQASCLQKTKTSSPRRRRER